MMHGKSTSLAEYAFFPMWNIALRESIVFVSGGDSNEKN